jgi:hypothetical protein
LALEKFRAARTLNPLPAGVVEQLKAFAGTPFDFGVSPTPEPQALMMQIGSLLESAGWQWVTPEKLGSIDINVTGRPPANIMTGFVGLGLEIDQSKVPSWRSALLALAAVLRQAVPDTKANIAIDGSAPPNAVHIYVGSKQ